MFYNTYRVTKSSMNSAEKNRLTGESRNIINQRSRLLNLQKRQKLKDLLITKFMQKYGIKNPETILEDEITKFLQGEKLTDMDLKRLDLKLKNILKKKASKEALKSSLTESLREIAPNQNKVILPKIDTKKELDNTLAPKITKTQPTRLSTEPGLNTIDQPKLNTLGTSYTPLNTYSSRKYRIKYKKPEEELAELEAEFAEEEKKNNKKYERLDFSEHGDEWSAIAKYNRKIFEDQIKEEKRKDQELKRRNKEDLDFQIKQKLKKEYEEELKDKEYDNIVLEHRKKMDELDREKEEKLKQQSMREKELRDEQMRQNNIRKRIEQLKEKKYERSLVKSIQEGIEKEKKEAIERKKKENEALLKAIKENDLKIKKKKEREKQEKEEANKMNEERIKMLMRQDLERQEYYDMIKKHGSNMMDQAADILEKMKKDQEEEDKRIQYYYEEKNKREIEKEKNEELKKHMNKFELKKYLDKQIIEKKKEEDFLKSMDYEQARIWKIDTKKYFDEQKAIDKKIREMNKRNLELVMEQLAKKKNKNKSMNDAEYAMNRDILEKAKESLGQQ